MTAIIKCLIKKEYSINRTVESQRDSWIRLMVLKLSPKVKMEAVAKKMTKCREQMVLPGRS
jgi:hypothetical protein